MNSKHTQPFETHETRVTSETDVSYSKLHQDTFNSQSVLGNAAIAEAATNTRPAGTSGFPTRAAMQPGFGASELQLKVGNSAIQRALQAASIQRKLAIGQPDDSYEREADQVAQMVVRMPAPSASTETSSPAVQRKCAACETGHGPCSKCAEEGQAIVQRKPLFSRITSFIQRHTSRSEGGGESELSRPVENQIKNTRGGGEPLSASARAFFEPRFGRDFSDVRVHVGSDANEMNQAVGARAFTHGSDIYFGAGHSPADLDLTAHELTHVVQQTGEGAATSDADPAVQRAPVTTNGGTFDTTMYDPIHAVAGAVRQTVGANIRLEFMANDLVESTKIGLIQSTKMMRSSVPGGLRDTIATSVGDLEGDQLIMGPGQADPGRAIDQAVHPNNRDAPSTSPVYGVGYATGGMEASLNQGTPTVGQAPTGSQWGSHTKDPVTHQFQPAVPARIEDGPWRPIQFPGQTFEHSFEVAALAVEGPIPVNTYLGSVSWGWRSDAAGQVTVAPLALTQAGAPSTAFMSAAGLWNAATFSNLATGAVVPSVDIPITTMDSGTVAAVDISTTALLTRIALVDSQLAGLAPGTDRTNKEFEKRALEAELPRRFVKVSVRVNSTEDWTGADEVYVKLTGPSGSVARSGERSLNDGDANDFVVPLVTLLPLTGPIQVQVYDADSPDADDLIVDMNFVAPWGAAHNSRSMDDANYDVTVTFER